MKAELMAQQSNWITVEYTVVPNKVVTEGSIHAPRADCSDMKRT